MFFFPSCCYFSIFFLACFIIFFSPICIALLYLSSSSPVQASWFHLVTLSLERVSVIVSHFLPFPVNLTLYCVGETPPHTLFFSVFWTSTTPTSTNSSNIFVFKDIVGRQLNRNSMSHEASSFISPDLRAQTFPPAPSTSTVVQQQIWFDYKVYI